MPLPRWIAPANPRRVWALLAIGTVLIAWRLLAAQGYLEWNARLHDKLQVLTTDDRRKFNAVLGWLYGENGVDAHVELLPGIGSEPLEQYTVRRMRELGIGRESDRRGLLLVYDRSSGRLRIEVGPTLEGLLTDAFVGHINRENLQHYVSADNVRDGLYSTLFMIEDRLRQAALGNEFDPRVQGMIEDSRRLALGAGQTTKVDSDGTLAARSATAQERAYFAPQPTVRAAFERFHEWLAYGGQPHDVPLFTVTSSEWFEESPNTRAFSEFWLMQEYGRSFRIEEKGKLAMLFFTDSPFAQPHFFRKGKEGWQLDLIGELLNTRNTIGGRYSWVLWESGDNFFRAFRERFVKYNGMLRLAGGDNRELPMRGDDSTVTVYEPLPIARTDSVMEHLTVIEAAERIRAARGRPALVMLYGSGYEEGYAALPWLAVLADSLSASGVEVLAFSTDQTEEVLRELPDRLRQLRAPFAPVHLYQWWSGMLDSAMATAGVRVGMQWRIPLVALLGPTGELLAQTQGTVPSASKLIERLKAAPVNAH